MCDRLIEQTKRFVDATTLLIIPSVIVLFSFFTAVGQRVFDVYVENSLLAAGFDAVQIAGPNTAIVLQQAVAISDGVVTIELVKDIENPMLNGIEIILTPAPLPSPTSTATRINVGGGQFVDSTGKTWIADNYFGGKGATYWSCPKAITNTVEDDLYCSNRWFAPWHGAPFVYEIPVPSSSQYRIRLHFAEIVSMHASAAEPFEPFLTLSGLPHFVSINSLVLWSSWTESV